MVPARPTVVLEVAQSPPARTLPARFLPAGSELTGGVEHASTDAGTSVWRSIFDVLIYE